MFKKYQWSWKQFRKLSRNWKKNVRTCTPLIFRQKRVRWGSTFQWGKYLWVLALVLLRMHRDYRCWRSTVTTRKLKKYKLEHLKTQPVIWKRSTRKYPKCNWTFRPDRRSDCDLTHNPSKYTILNFYSTGDIQQLRRNRRLLVETSKWIQQLDGRLASVHATGKISRAAATRSIRECNMRIERIRGSRLNTDSEVWGLDQTT